MAGLRVGGGLGGGVGGEGGVGGRRRGGCGHRAGGDGGGVAGGEKTVVIVGFVVRGVCRARYALWVRWDVLCPFETQGLRYSVEM